MQLIVCMSVSASCFFQSNQNICYMGNRKNAKACTEPQERTQLNWFISVQLSSAHSLQYNSSVLFLSVHAFEDAAFYVLPCSLMTRFRGNICDRNLRFSNVDRVNLCMFSATPPFPRIFLRFQILRLRGLDFKSYTHTCFWSFGTFSQQCFLVSIYVFRFRLASVAETNRIMAMYEKAADEKTAAKKTGSKRKSSVTIESTKQQQTKQQQQFEVNSNKITHITIATRWLGAWRIG